MSHFTGAVALHAPTMALLMHPVSWHHRASHTTQQVPQVQKVPPVIPLVNGYAVDKRLQSTKQGLLRGASVPVDLLKLGGGLKLDAVTQSPIHRLRTGSECHHPDSLWMGQRGSAFRLGDSTLIAGSVLTLQNETVRDMLAVYSEGNCYRFLYF